MSRLSPDFWARPFAHRGFHGDGRPENSLAALEAAIDAGFGIEFDVQASADGEAMVFHDYTLQRLSGEDGRTDARSTADLQSIHLAGTDQTIPTLAEALALIRGRVPVLIEIKDQSTGFLATDGALERRACEVVKAAGFIDSYAMMSFNPFSANHMREALPEMVRGLVSYDFAHPAEAAIPSGHRQDLASLRWFHEVGGEFISYGAGSLPSAPVAALRKQGVPVFCWTIRSEEQASAALEHSDQITFEGYRPAG